MPSPEPEVVVAGAGPMAEEHVRALLSVGVAADDLLVVGRGRERVEALAARHGVRARWGGAESLESCARVAVVAVEERAEPLVARALIAAGARCLLLEKPGALTSAELEPIRAGAARAGAAVFVGYNRRFYPSVVRAAELIEQDGGPLAASFEFTEVERLVLADAERRSLPEETLARWGAANSLHVIDLAFFLIGAPVDLACERAGTLAWHPSGSVFAGSGTTDRGALFAYWATWGGAGRWGVEVTTAERKLVLRPLEELRQQLRGTFALEPVEPAEAEAEADELKPGLRRQAAALLAAASGEGPDTRLCTLDEACERLVVAERMLGYA